MNLHTIDQVACYLTEVKDIANNENLRMKYFSSSLTKNASPGLQPCLHTLCAMNMRQPINLFSTFIFLVNKLSLDFLSD